VDGRHHMPREWRGDRLPALLSHFEGRRDQRLGGGGAEADHDLGPEDPDLGIEPEPACRDLAPIRLFVEATLSCGTPLEVLHRIGDVDRVAVDASGRERIVEHSTGRPDERLAGDILVIARLFADENDLRRPTALAEYGLRRVLP